MSDVGLVEALGALGFHLNEARAYAALLTRGSSTGYEVSQHAGIPRSAVYAVLRKLVSEGAARRTPGPPERFSPTPAEALVAQLERRFESKARTLRDAVARLDTHPETPEGFGVEGYERIVEEAVNVVRQAEHRVVVGGWPREIELLTAELSAAARRAVDVVVFSHARLPAKLPGTRFSYGYDERDLEAFWGHRLVVVADERVSLLAAAEGTAADRAIVSKTPAIAAVAVDQVVLDITLLAQRHGRDVGPVVARILGPRVGRLDSLTADPRGLELGDTKPTSSERRDDGAGTKRSRTTSKPRTASRPRA
jgi:sugar-specific transcriptional regulator TrmB